MEQVLPHVPYRQWTLSFPNRVRWVLLKDVGLLSDVLTVFLRAVFALQRRRARRQGLRGGQAGAVSFIQFFGSALQVTPHFHSLVPDGVFVPREGGVRFEPLPPPTQGEVERLLRVVRHRVLRLLEKRGAVPAQGPEDALQVYQAHSLPDRHGGRVGERHRSRATPPGVDPLADVFASVSPAKPARDATKACAPRDG